ncbi:hypothetical protein [Pseudomonas aeruginosa]|uniref:hypothetical protein n=1 Tax=Pseudomonas aeruginosa TaxID=287 RepID=UPI000AD1BB26|nr:hypothetical protein [Pseudomonas aeruginosa]HBN9510730.1 hypothetical protein [Pseudomonas aeruginosa]HBN9781648.1 hypothetical protein [Pseudomonas aeruginosa]HBN9851300.1 hypothetical protein [Pseudomonas aeruginosa]HBN9864708.1 hypothetical protein [Pseudomonas aeruginosa]HBN9896080.1 hypothetical protein [Pseudomonas aeruginosa]
MATDWKEARKNMFSTECPPDWPDGVRGISHKGVGFLGVHEKSGELYWDGRKVVVHKPVTLGALNASWLHWLPSARSACWS